MGQRTRSGAQFQEKAPYRHREYHPEKSRFSRQFKGTFPAPRSGAPERVRHASLVDTHHRYPVEGDPPRRPGALPVALDGEVQRPRKTAAALPKTGPFPIEPVFAELGLVGRMA